MNKIAPQLISAALVLAAALAFMPQPVLAATARAEASAVIRNGIAIRAPGGSGSAPLIQGASSGWPPARTVVRQCRPGDPASAQCKIVLLELQ